MTQLKNFSPLFSSSVFLFFTACSGGFLSVSNNVDVYKPAKFQVEALESAAPSVRVQIVQDLYGKRGDNLDWSEFWSRLRASTERAAILADVEGALLPLHERGCNAPAYSQFVRLVVDLARGYEFVIGDKARCDLSLGAELSVLVAQGFLKSREGLELNDPESRQLLSFLNRQIEASPEGKWREFCREDFEPDVRRLIETNFASGRTQQTVRWMVAIHRASGKFPLRSFLFERVIVSSELLRNIIQEVGFTEATVLVSDLIDTARSRITSGEVQVSPSQAAALVNELWAESVAKPTSIAQIWPNFSRFKRTLLVLGRAWSLRERLQLQNQLLLKIEDSVRAASAQDREIFFSLVFHTHAGSAADLDTLWLMLRVAHEKLEASTDRENARGLVARTMEEVSGAEERVLAHRLLVHLADGGKRRREALDLFCDELERSGLAPSTPSFADAKQMLTQGMEAGCYRLPLSKDTLAITGQAVRMSPDAALRVDAPKLILQVAQADLGMLDLSRVDTFPPFDAVLARKKEVVIPLPVVYEVMDPPAGTAPGRHVFYTHVVFPQTPIPAPVGLLAGVQGGILSAQIETAPRTFAFVSQGARGQLDRRMDHSQFLDAGVQALLSGMGAGLAGSHRTTTAQSLLLIAGGRSPLGAAAYSSAILPYLGTLPDYYKDKMKAKCSELSGTMHTTDTQLVQCFKDRLIPEANLQASNDVQRLESAGDSAPVRESVERRFEGKKPVWRPEANPTQPFQEGPRGADGVVEGISGGSL